ncbi:MAG TPA: TolC family protein [Candidatus Binataceae bacterium]|nr:TolC family protein [Candidatus Binataceae bacterium]
MKRVLDILVRLTVTRCVALICVIGMMLLAVRGYCQTLSSPAPAASVSPAPAGMLATTSAPAPLIGAQSPPNVNIKASAANRFRVDDSIISLPKVLLHQWWPAEQIPPEAVISEPYLSTSDLEFNSLTLKQAVYLAIENNPTVKADQMDPLAGTEAVRMAWGVFDPDLLATVDTVKSVSPAQSTLVARSGTLSTKNYDWNFTLNKVLTTTNGTLSLLFSNDRQVTNNFFVTVNPEYTSALTMSLTQPLMRNFGMNFATLNVRMAESGQLQTQWNYAQSLEDFVRQVANDYWNVVLSEENLRVAAEALKFDQDLVRENRISLRVGTLAPIDLQEAQSAAATDQANLYSAEAGLKSARVILRQDVMLNPSHRFLPRRIEPAEAPNPDEPVEIEEERSLELAVQYRPALAALREAVRTAEFLVKYQTNQLLPQFNLVAQFGLSSIGGDALCGSALGLPPSEINCVSLEEPSGGFMLPFSGDYAETLNRMFGTRFYNYAIQFNFELPLDNAPIRAQLAQARIGYEQARVQYRAGISRVVVEVENSLANLTAAIRRVKATRAATEYARQSLHDEQVRFRVGLATTHDLLQYEDALVTAEGQEVQADVDLENAKVALRDSDGTLLRSFQIKFQIQSPHEPRPWYALF